jgi:hypothetical protein
MAGADASTEAALELVAMRGTAARTATDAEETGAGLADLAMAETAGAGCAAGPSLQLVQIEKLTSKPNFNPSERVMPSGRATAAPAAFCAFPLILRAGACPTARHAVSPQPHGRSWTLVP